MSPINRRQFLQFSASALATIGLSQGNFLRQAQGADRVLAQGKPGRKLALLVGINQYPAGVGNLAGCVTDVEMQYELLVHRYGFSPKDILVLADRKLAPLDYTPQTGTRANILDAFQRHLIQQAQPEDTVVFHYSGHGSLISDPNPLPNYNGSNGTLVPADVILQGDETNQIMGKTLFLLSSLLNTDRFTMVLDSCHSGGGTRGNGLVRAVQLRSRRSSGLCIPNAEELALQEKLMTQLKLSPEEFQKRRIAGIARGVALGSALKEQEAIDAYYDGFSAGTFSYLLTRYLWQLPQAEALKTTFGTLGLATKEASNRTQEPIYEVQPQKEFDRKPIYIMSADQSTSRAPFADAVVRSVEDDRIRFWMGGVNSQSLMALTKGAVFEVIDAQGKSIATVEQLDRKGLVGIGKLKPGSAAGRSGMLMRERIRSIPTDLKLRVGIDPNLGTEVETARAAIANIPRMEAVVLDPQAPVPVDCILGRLTERSQTAATRGSLTINEPLNSIGLFNAQGTPIPGTFQAKNLRTDRVVYDLRSQLKLLLANQILGSTVNGDRSSLKVKTVIRPQGRASGPVITQTTAGLGIQPHPDLILTQGYRASTPEQKSIAEVLISNEEEENSLHVAVFAINDDASIQLLYPANWNSPETASLIQEKQMKSFDMVIEGPAGFFQILVIASAEPLRGLLQGIQKIASERTNQTIVDLIGDSLVTDLSRKSSTAPASGNALIHSSSVGVIAIPVRVEE